MIYATKKNDYLIHYGVKGMKWGVRRYQNPDGTLTPRGQKRLYKKIKKTKDENIRKKLIRDNISKSDNSRYGESYSNFLKKTESKEAKGYELTRDRLATKYAKDVYRKEYAKNKELYDTPKAKDKLYGYAKYDVGYEKADKELSKNSEYSKYVNAKKETDKAYDQHVRETKRIVNSVVGKYGDKKVKDVMTNRNEYKYLVEDVLLEEYLKNVRK